MNFDTRSSQQSRKLIAYLYDGFPPLFDNMIEKPLNNYPQLVHKQQLPYTEKPSRSSRLAVRVGLKKYRQPSIEDTVMEAYTFISQNYEPGDQVILRVDPYIEGHQTPLMTTAEALARHLYDGTRPGALFSIQSGDAGEAPARRIPVHCIVVLCCARIESVVKWNDELKSRFPPGIKHVISWTYHDAGNDSQSCSSHFDTDGSMTSRELFFFRGAFPSPMVFFHATKDIICFKHNQVLELVQRDSVWTRVINSSPGGNQGIHPSESTNPGGMHHHELRKHELPPKGMDPAPRSILVWRSSRR